MTNNDIFRRIRYILGYDDGKMVSVYQLTDAKVTRAQICDWLKQDEDPKQDRIKDIDLATFLNGLIIEKRGKKEGPQPAPETRLTNNIIFNKLKIAFNLKAEDVLDMLALADFDLGKSELTAFFRKPNHKNYRQCQSQVLRNFMLGLQYHYTKKESNKADSSASNKEKPNTAWPGKS